MNSSVGLRVTRNENNKCTSTCTGGAMNSVNSVNNVVASVKLVVVLMMTIFRG